MEKVITIILSLLIGFFLVGCETKKEELSQEAKKLKNISAKKSYEAKIKKEKEDKLKNELAANRNAILENIKKFVEAKEYAEALKLIEKYSDTQDEEILKLQKQVAEKYNLNILSKLPSSKIKENLELYKKLVEISPLNTKYKKKVAHYETKLQEFKNRNNTGIWEIRRFVDKFGDLTNEKYITNSKLIRGTFSNTATQNSKLNVEFIITKDSISIQLFEYASNNPVKNYRDVTSYEIYIKDKNGKKYHFGADNFSDRITLVKYFNNSFNQILFKGGNVRFYMYEYSHPSTKYHFEIENANFYKNAYRMLNE